MVPKDKYVESYFENIDKEETLGNFKCIVCGEWVNTWKHDKCQNCGKSYPYLGHKKDGNRRNHNHVYILPDDVKVDWSWIDDED